MAGSLVVAAVQLAAHSRASFESVWPRIAGRIEAAAAAGARLVVLPEATLPSYVLGYERYNESETERELRQCRALAEQHRIVLVVGAARREGERVFNSAIIIDADGSIAGCADKHFLWHFDRQWFAPGEHIAPVQTSLGSIGALVCADGRIPTIARTLVDRGAEILVMPTAWVTSGRDPQNLENAQADLLARVRARENGVPFVAANKCGTELGCVAYCGKSQIVAADGAVVAAATQHTEETILAKIELAAGPPLRSGAGVTVHDSSHDRTLRIAITPRTRTAGDEQLLRILEADVLISAAPSREPEELGFSYLDVDDPVVLDPGGLVDARLRGYRLAVWRSCYEPQWQVTFARARALELRMYIAVIDTEHERAYAVDPDGTVMCGTFAGYEIASFAYDPARAQQTAVAPGSDVLEGLRRAGTHALE